MLATTFAILQMIAGPTPPTFICYTPAELDPRNAGNNAALKTSSLTADLTALRPHFDGLILYGYHEACTPRILAVAKRLKYRAVFLGVWDPKSAAELDGVAALAKLHQDDFALGVIVGNEGITFNRYEFADLPIAAARLRKTLPAGVPLTTSEPLVGYDSADVVGFGDLLLPNIHPVFDRSTLAPADAAKWVREQAVALAKKADRPVVVKETGFPHAGKPAYTPASQNEFWTAYLKPGTRTAVGEGGKTWAYFGAGFEAFDLPWKAEASGLPIEKSWGLFDTDRKPYPAAELWRPVTP